MVRCVSEQDKLEIHRRITLAVEHAAGSTGAEAVLDLSEGFPPVVNDETCTRIVREAARHRRSAYLHLSDWERGVGAKAERRRGVARRDKLRPERRDHRTVVGAERKRRHAQLDALRSAAFGGQLSNAGVCRDSPAEQ